MRFSVILVFLFLSLSSFAQYTDVQLDNTFLDGYDLVSYFDYRATPGKDKYLTEYNGHKLKFSTAINFEKFSQNPGYYMPQFDGWCAYTVSTSRSMEEANPELFEIRNGKLYVFCNESLKLWLSKKPNSLLHQANKNWEEMNFIK